MSKDIEILQAAWYGVEEVEIQDDTRITVDKIFKKTPQAIEIAEEGAKILINTPEGIRGVKGIYETIAKIGTPQAIEIAKRWIEILRKEKGFGWDVKQIEKAMNIKNNSSQFVVNKNFQIKKEGGGVYRTTDNINNIKQALQFAEKPIDDGRFEVRQRIFYGELSYISIYIPEDLLDN